MKKTILTLSLSVIAILLFSNNIQLSNTSLTGQVLANQTVQVKFDLSWENGWRTSTTVPLNWDAAWVFIKYKVVGGEWHHAKLSTSGYTGPTTCTIDMADDSTGAFIYLSEDGSGNVSFNNLELQWAYGVNGVGDDDMVEVRVFAIEMVYIPSGPFYAGDGLNEAGRGQFYEYGTYNPYYVSSEGPIQCGITAGNLWAGSVMNVGMLPADYPKGFAGFYCMKYEISQDQYKQFLNTLTRTQQNYHTFTDIGGTSVTNIFVMSNTATPSSNNGIRCYPPLPASGPIYFYMDLDNDGSLEENEDGNTLAANWLRWMDLAAYLDWAALRPLSELEYEKVCRGPKNPVMGEYPWGNTRVNTTETYLWSYGTPLDTLVSFWDVGNVNYQATNPVNVTTMRCGIFAASAWFSSRMETGAGYYGCMELAGNVLERVVQVGYVAGRSFTSLNGNGELNEAGHADVDYWPGMNGNSYANVLNPAYDPLTGIGVTHVAGIGLAGGHYSTTDTLEMRTSDRNKRNTALSIFSDYRGGRGCRTAD